MLTDDLLPRDLQHTGNILIGEEILHKNKGRIHSALFVPIWLLICCIPNEKFTDKDEHAIPCHNLTVDLLQAPVDISCGGFPVTRLTTTRIQANQPAGESCP